MPKIVGPGAAGFMGKGGRHCRGAEQERSQGRGETVRMPTYRHVYHLVSNQRPSALIMLTHTAAVTVTALPPPLRVTRVQGGTRVKNQQGLL